MKELNPIDVIDYAQEQIWNLHHKVKEYDEELGMKIWEWTLQIEHAVGKLRDLQLKEKAQDK